MKSRLFRLSLLPRTHITHVKQLHMPFRHADNSMLEHIAYSQYGVVRAILANPQAIVVQEEQHEDLTPKEIKDHRFVPLAQRFFPQGLPDKFDAMNKVQKEFLAKIKGANTLFYLGKLSHLFKSETKAEALRINSGIAVGRLDFIFAPREKLALYWAKQAAMREFKPDVLLVYGAGHNFKAQIKQLNDPSIVYKKSINTLKITSESKEEKKPSHPKSFFAESRSLIIPKEADEDPDSLFEDFIPDLIKHFISNHLTSLTELQTVYEASPWVIENLLSKKNIQDAFSKQLVSLKELSKLTEIQCNEITDDLTSEQLREKINELSKGNAHYLRDRF